MSKLNDAVDDATQAVIDAWEANGFKTSKIDLDTAADQLSDYLRSWMKTNLRPVK